MLWRDFWTLLRIYREEGKLEKTFTNTQNPQDQTLTYTKSPTHGPSSCELSKLWTCVQSLGSVWGVTASFWGAAPKQRTVHRGCSGHSECKSAIAWHLWWEKKSHYPDISGLFFFFFFLKRIDRTEFSQEPEPVPSAAGVSEIAACPLSPVANDSSALPSPTSSLPLLFSPVHSIPELICQLFYCTTVLSKILQDFKIFFIFVFYVLFVSKYHKPITAQYCSLLC